MNNELPSTGVADRKQLFIQSIKKSVGFVNQGQWNEKNLVGETTFLNGIIYQSINGKVRNVISISTLYCCFLYATIEIYYHCFSFTM